MRRTARRLEKRFLSLGMPPASGWLLPQFFGIGATKAGTTWLHSQLRCHPDLFVSARKELHYFDHHFDESLRTYARHFKSGRGRLRGEITPGYGLLPEDRIRFIHRLMPELKLILMIRNPVDRAWSHALMRLAKGRTLEEIPDYEFYTHFLGSASRQRCDYIAMVERWLAVYPPERLFVGHFEDVSECPRELLSRIFRHLGVSEPHRWDPFPVTRKIREGVGYRMPDRFRKCLEELYADDIERMIQRFGPRCEAWRPASRTQVRFQAAQA